MRAFALKALFQLVVLLLILGCGEVLLVETASAQERIEPDLRPAPPAQKKKKKKKKKGRRSVASDIPIGKNGKKKRRRKAFVENHLQGERRREREARMSKSPLDSLETAIGGSLRLEGRHFPSPSDNPATVGSNYSIVGEFEASVTYDEFEGKVWNLARVDFSDDGRTRILPYENWLAYKTTDFQLKVGMQIENWAMSEIFHPSDVFNSRNIDSELESSEKIGEPAVSARFSSFGGFLTLYYMPLFWTPILPSEKSRLSVLPPNVSLLDSVFVTDGQLKENDALVDQYAARYTHQFGDADISAHYLSSVDRQQPLFATDVVDNGIRPVFLPVDQVGINGSIVSETLIYKFDVVQRKFRDSMLDPSMGILRQPDHSIVAFGGERAFSLSSGAEATLYIEWQKIFGVEGDEARRLSIFQNDLMIGTNLAFNNLDNSELRAFFILDMDDSSETLWSVSYTQKITANFKVAGGYRGISVMRGLSKQLNDADHLFLNLTYFFER